MKFIGKALLVTFNSASPGNESDYRKIIREKIYRKKAHELLGRDVFLSQLVLDNRYDERDLSFRDRLLKFLWKFNPDPDKNPVEIIKELDDQFRNLYFPLCFGVFGKHDVLSCTLIDDFDLVNRQTGILGGNIQRSTLGLLTETSSSIPLDDFINCFSPESQKMNSFLSKYPFIGHIQYQLSHFSSLLFINDIKKSLMEMIISKVKEKGLGKCFCVALETLANDEIVVLVFSKSYSHIQEINTHINGLTLKSLLDLSSKTFDDAKMEFDERRLFYLNTLNGSDPNNTNYDALHIASSSLLTLAFSELIDCRWQCDDKKLCDEAADEYCRNNLYLVESTEDAEISMAMSIKTKPGHEGYVKDATIASLSKTFNNITIFTLSQYDLQFIFDLKESQIPRLVQLITKAHKTMKCDLYRIASELLLKSSSSSPRPTHPYLHKTINEIHSHYDKNWRNHLILGLCKLKVPSILRHAILNTYEGYFAFLSKPELFSYFIDLFPIFHNFYLLVTNHGKNDECNFTGAYPDSMREWLDKVNWCISAAYLNSIEVWDDHKIIPEYKIDLTRLISMSNGILRSLQDIALDGNREEREALDAVTLITSKHDVEISYAYGGFLELNIHHFFSPETSLLTIFHEAFHIIQRGEWFKELYNELSNILIVLNDIEGLRASHLKTFFESIINDIISDSFETYFLFGGDQKKAYEYRFVKLEMTSRKYNNNYWNEIVPVGLVRMALLSLFIEYIEKTPQIINNDNPVDVRNKRKLVNAFSSHANEFRSEPGASRLLFADYIDSKLAESLKEFAPTIYQKWMDSSRMLKKSVQEHFEDMMQQEYYLCVRISDIIRDINLEHNAGTPEAYTKVVKDAAQYLFKMYPEQYGLNRERGKFGKPLPVVFLIILTVIERWRKYIDEPNSTIKSREKIKIDVWNGVKVAFTPNFATKSNGIGNDVQYEQIRFISGILHSLWHGILNAEGGISFWERRENGRLLTDTSKGRYSLDDLGGGFSLDRKFREELFKARCACIVSLSTIGVEKRLDIFEEMQSGLFNR